MKIYYFFLSVLLYITTKKYKDVNRQIMRNALRRVSVTTKQNLQYTLEVTQIDTQHHYFISLS